MPEYECSRCGLATDDASVFGDPDAHRDTEVEDE